MKKLTIFLVLITYISCSTPGEITEEEIVAQKKDIEIVFTTTELDFDEIMVHYRDFDNGDWIYGPRQFEYDSVGNPLPMVIFLPDYKHPTVEGNAYRNNNLPSALKVQLFINDSLVLEDESVGSSLNYATVNFDYLIDK